MAIRWGARWICLLAAFCAAALSRGAGPIELRVRPVWESLNPGSHRSPFLVTVRNNTSSDAIGRLVVEGAEGTDIVPLEVARQSQKVVAIFPLVEMPPLRVAFESRAGGAHVDVPFPVGYTIRRVGMIGDGSGELAFLKLKRLQDGAVIMDETIGVGYCRPEDAPERPVGLFPLDAVFLGEGCERLNERQIEALKQYVVQGGRLVIPGGANVPLLSSAVWRNLLPLSDAAPKTFPSGLTLTMSNGRGKVRVNDPITLMLGRPFGSAMNAATADGAPVSLVRPVGLGSVVFLGYSPFEEPILSHPNRRQLVLDAMKVARYGASSTLILEVALSTSRDYSDETWPRSSPGIRTGPPVPAGSPIAEEAGIPTSAESLYAHSSIFPMQSLENSPFNVRLIPSSTVGWIFVGFFLVVVPLNFVVLRLLKRMEWAWVTTPLLSILFAGILLSAAGGLYSAKLSKAFTGFVVQDLDAGLSAQWLRASYFMPRGGSYNLTLPNTDQVLPPDHFRSDFSSYRYGYRGDVTPSNEITSVDDGTAAVPRMDVPNLAFRELAYHRIETPPLEVEISLRRQGAALAGSVANKSRYTLYRVALVVKGDTYLLPDLSPGSSFQLSAGTRKIKSAASHITSGRSGGEAVLYALMRDFDPGGPGDLAPDSTKVLLICTKEVGGTK